MQQFSVFLNSNLSHIITGYVGHPIDKVISYLKEELKEVIFDEIIFNLTQRTTFITLISNSFSVKIPILFKNLSELAKLMSGYKNILSKIIYVRFLISNNYLDLYLKIYEKVKSKNISVEFFKDTKQVYDFYISDPDKIKLPIKSILYTNRYYTFDRFPMCKYERVYYMDIDFFQELSLISSYYILFNKCEFDSDITISFR
jgi:hypothetical protein